jgi:hypothetical protein
LAGVVAGSDVGDPEDLTGSLVDGVKALLSSGSEDTAARALAITAKLQAHVNAAAADFDSHAIGMSAKQAAAAGGSSSLAAAYRGSIIDAAAKARVSADPTLDVGITENFIFGPDFFVESGRWWDMTTEGEWAEHVRKYSGQFGTGTMLSTGG